MWRMCTSSSARRAALAGIAKNNTDHEISTAELVFDLTDRVGSRQGAVTTELKNIASKILGALPIRNRAPAATFALVREVHVR